MDPQKLSYVPAIAFGLLLLCGFVIFILLRKLAQSRQLAAKTILRIRDENAKQLAAIDAELEKERRLLLEDKTRIENHYEAASRSLIEELEPLRRFKGIADAETEAQKILAEAVKLAEELRTEAQAYSARARAKSETEMQALQERIKQLQTEADRILSRATNEASRLTKEAHSRAEEIAGDAYKALQEKDALNGAILSIRNIIEGYGDKYVIPTHSVIDDLAASYGHMEAGVALQAAREQSRRMVEQQHAADCDYAEMKRRETAIRFVVDAFNGRVDAILSRTKSDNFGTLTQEIQDAFNLVNLNGEAFRNAHILPAYLEARLAELKWAVAVQELRQRERDEQRRIQEQIREEEKVRKEIEHAIKESEKEEEVLQRAMAKARAEIAEASQGEKARWEARLLDLQNRLTEAEAKNQRALSMAQQTKAGHVYIISNIGSFGEDVVKIGMTRRLEPMDRIRELGDASVPFPFDVHAMIYSDDAPKLEYDLHEEFADKRLNKVNFRKEHFRVPIKELRDFVTERRLTASFTMLADAQEYRESIALSKSPNISLAIVATSTADENDE